MKWFRRIKKEFKKFWQAMGSTPEEQEREIKSFRDLKKVPQKFREFLQRFKAKNLTIGDVCNISLIGAIFLSFLLLALPFPILTIIWAMTFISLNILFFAILGLFFRERTPTNIALAVAAIPLLPTVVIVNYLFYKFTGIGWWVKGFPGRKQSIEPFLHDPGWYLGVMLAIVVCFITYIMVKDYLRRKPSNK